MKYWVIVLIVLLAGALVWGIFFSGMFKSHAPANTNPYSTDTGQLASLQPASLTQQSPASSTPANNSNSSIVVLDTSLGQIKISLDASAAPRTVANFEKLVGQKFYDGLTFHRIVPGFVIQGGDPKGDGTGGPGYTVPAEIKLPHKRGSVAMARLSDQVNPNRDSSGSQFYVALQDLPQLDNQYTVFGQVTEGMDVVDQIAAVKTDPATDKPLQPVIIKKATLQQ
jgi:peptidyl-prolyl cis-trans isomerase B (cyclophilin B)